ncbi:unnamed protein product, partial [Hymenolepis diminuta]
IAETNVGEVWSAANATKNEDLIGVCAPLVARNWNIFRTSRLFYMNTEIKGMMSLLECPWMSQESATSKMKALLLWRNASRDDEVRTARTTAFRDMVSLLRIQDTPDLVTDLFEEDINIPVKWRRWLAEGRKTAEKQPIASSSMPSSSMEVKKQSFDQERLATFEYTENAAQVRILNPENSELEIKLQLPEIEFTNIFAFQNKLVFIGGLEIKNNPFTRRVDLMDVSTGQVSPLPDMIIVIQSSVGVGTENEIFVFGKDIFLGSYQWFVNQFYNAASGRRVIF